MKEVVIIGGGAAGLMTAINIAKTNKVTIIERNADCGKKLLITGNGKCNYYNQDQALNHYHSNTEELISHFITNTNLANVLEIFNNIGIVPTIKNGYFYPFSNQAITIKTALLTEAKRLNVNFKYNVLVEKITKEDSKFIIKTNNTKLKADVVVLATGSLSAPKTGSTGIGYEILKKFHHTIYDPTPSLVQLKVTTNLEKIAGVRTDVKLSLYKDEKLVKEESGQLQFTKDTLSGICVFNLSYYVGKLLPKKCKITLKINFLPFLSSSREENLKWMDSRNLHLHNPKLSILFETILNYKLVAFIFKQININSNLTWKELTLKQKELIMENFLTFNFVIKGTNSFLEAQTCSGGVSLKEIDLKTMESKIVKNLYVVGELLDITGDCGGYNLTIAWISALIAGKNI